VTNRRESALLGLLLFSLSTGLTRVCDESIFTEHPVYCARMTEEPTVSHLAGESAMILIDDREL